jgi:hypothetical protein
MKILKTFMMSTVLALLAGSALADPQSVGTYEAWGAFTSTTNGQTICYMSAKPTKSEGDYKKRNPVFAEVTDRPAEHRLGVFNILAGYSLKSSAPATLEIGKQSFTLFTHGDAAFAQDADDPRIVAAMKGGDTMVFKGTSTKGTQTTDTFSLKGADAAYAEIGRACKVDAKSAKKS